MHKNLRLSTIIDRLLQQPKHVAFGESILFSGQQIRAQWAENYRGGGVFYLEAIEE